MRHTITCAPGAQPFAQNSQSLPPLFFQDSALIECVQMSASATSSLELKMNSATKVGEIFTKAGDSYNKIGDMLVMLHPAAQELIALEEANQQKLLAFEVNVI